MHGRVKVRTTEEGRERKKKEQELKMRAYRAAMGRIQKKRSTGELDDEMLLLTVQVLQRNPDISTLWNIRRECVLAQIEELRKQTPAEAAPPPPNADDSAAVATTTTITDDKVQFIYASELRATEQCLMVNPKSYNAWHHRCWTLEQNPLADWQWELQLCNKYLKYDERNFHTWDYRRYVMAKAQVPQQQELDFCTDKIKVNFSNYSSWHHRSLLLPILYPYEGTAPSKRPMSEAKLKEELEMVLTAAFTDPNDSSAWFYQRWLLGSGAQQEAPTVAAFRCGAQGALLAFNKSHVHFAQSKVQLVTPTQTLELQQWTSANASKSIWRCATPLVNDYDESQSQSFALQLAEQTLPLCVLPGAGLYYFQPPQTSAGYCEEVLIELRSQLQSCLDLLEYEPDSKWTLLTSALLMRAIDAAAHHTQSLVHLSKLETVDELRAGYYKDLAARWSQELALVQWPQSPLFPKQFQLSAEAAALKSLPYAQYLIIADELQLPSTLQKQLADDLPQTFADIML